jgi:hypothetical protein
MKKFLLVVSLFCFIGTGIMAQESPPVVPDKPSPVFNPAFYILLPVSGLGQLCNKEWVKGSIMLGIYTASFATLQYIGSTGNNNNVNATIGAFSALGLLGSLTWSILDSMHTYSFYAEKMKVYKMAVKEREAYDKKMQIENSPYSPREKLAIFSNEIFVGMSEGAMLASWGMAKGMTTWANMSGIWKMYNYQNYYVTVCDKTVVSWSEK